MKHGFWRNVRRWAAVGCVAATAIGTTYAQEPLPQQPAKDPIGELKERMDRLEKENQELRQIIKNQSIVTHSSPGTVMGSGEQDKSQVEKIVADYIKGEDKKKKDAEEKKKKEDEAKGFEVGSDLKMLATWNNGVVLQTANRDFRMHIGGRFDYDNVWWHQPLDLQRNPPPGGNLGVNDPATRGVGKFEDGNFFRRVRLQFDGALYEVIEFNCEVDFENLNQIVYDEMWVGISQLPILGNVRFGQHKIPQGLESYSSSKVLVTLERSAVFDAFWLEFGTGIFAGNAILDQRATWAAFLYRPEIAAPATGAVFDDGEYAFTGRVTGLPYYQWDGRCLVHVGASYTWREPSLDRTSALPGTPLASVPAGKPENRDVARFRSRAELRDAISTFGNNNRFVDTGNIICSDVQTFSPEFLAILGPFSLQAEGARVQCNNAIFPASATGLEKGSTSFWGAYVMATYCLTGENRGYNRASGRVDRVKPNENFFLVRGDDDCTHHGIGAWELVYRYSFVDCNDPNANINGGQLTEHTFGLNWYLNPNVKIQANYLIVDRNVKSPAISGQMEGFGIRVHYDY